MRFFLSVLLLLPAFAAEDCAPPEPVLPTGALSGALSDASCRMSDGSLYAEYLVVLPVRGRLEVEVTAEVSVLLRDAWGRRVAGSAVEHGRHRVVVYGRQPRAFTLRTRFTPEPGAMCRNWRALGLNHKVAGRLDESSCRLPDGGPFEGFRLVTLGSGALEITLEAEGFSPLLILRDEEGRAVATGEGNLAAELAGGEVYTVVAAGSGAGSYRLSTRYQTADSESCRPSKTFSAPEEHKGRISVSSCVAGEHYYNYYLAEVAEAGMLEVRAASAAFDPGLRLADASGEIIAAGAGALRQQIRPGMYQVQIFGLPRFGGDYTLQYTFRPGLPEIAPMLTLPSLTRAGSLGDGGREAYGFTLDTTGVLEAAVSGAATEARLVLRDAQDNLLAEGGDKLRAALSPGFYTLAVVGRGAFELAASLTPGPLPACDTVLRIEPNQAFIGRLREQSCAGADGQPLDTYQFTLPSDGTIAAVITSGEIDSRLVLDDSEGRPLRRDDDSYGGGDALIIQHLRAGSYRLRATGAIGLYRLDLLFAAGEQAPDCRPMRTVRPGEAVAGRIHFTSCQFADDTFADLYTLDLPEPARLELDVREAAFEPDLRLIDRKGNLLDQKTALDPGIYHLIVKPFKDYSSTGPYHIFVGTTQ